MLLNFVFSFLLLFLKQTLCDIKPGFHDCLRFFYNKDQPQYFLGRQTDTKDICQRKEGTGISAFTFATKFDTNLKIPRYSAYSSDLKDESVGTNKGWAVELGLSGKGNGQGERIFPPERDIKGWTPEEKAMQPMYSDYIASQYTRGHLSPKSYHDSYDAQTSTNTLTNVLPQRMFHNAVVWSEMERTTKKIMKEDCSSKLGGGKNFFITGGIPGIELIKSKVRVPTHFYTAVCCKKKNPADSFSFGFISRSDKNAFERMRNFPVRAMDVKSLGEEVKRLWKVDPKPTRAIQFFSGDKCNPESQKSEASIEKLKSLAKTITFIDKED